jgi:peptide/nickel transport system substrate-binding protein
MKGEHQSLICVEPDGPGFAGDPASCYHSKTPRTACNYTGFNNPEFDKLLDDAAQEGDMAKREELLKKANATCSTKRRRSGSSTTTRP